MRCDVMLTFSLPSRSTSLIPQVQTVVGVIGSLEKHVERQQCEKREATASAASVNEEELNVEESPAGGDDLVQSNNDVTGDDGNLCPPVSATAISTAEVTGGKKRSRDETSSNERRYPRNVSAQTRSMKRAKLPHSTVHETSEVSGTTSQPRVVRRSARRTTTTREGAFEGTSRGIEAEVADANFMPIHEEDGSPLDDGDDYHDDEDDKQGIVANLARQGGSAIKSFDEHFKDLVDFKQKFGHCDVSRKQSSEYQSLGNWCHTLRTSYKKIQKKETSDLKLTPGMIQQLDDAGFRWSLVL